MTDTTVVVVELYPAISTSTAFYTNIVTVLGCPPWAKNCPVQHSVAVVTATTALQTTICPLTMTSERLSKFSTNVLSSPKETPAPPLSRTTTTAPTTYSLPESYTLRGTDSHGSEYDIPSSVWSSHFPSGLPSVSASTSEDPTASATSLISLSSILSFSTSVSIYNSVITVPNGPPTESISMGSLTAIIPINTTSLLPAYVPYPLPSNSSFPPNATFSPTGSTTTNSTIPWYTNSGYVASSDLYCIVMAVLVAALIF